MSQKCKFCKSMDLKESRNNRFYEMDAKSLPASSLDLAVTDERLIADNAVPDDYRPQRNWPMNKLSLAIDIYDSRIVELLESRGLNSGEIEDWQTTILTNPHDIWNDVIRSDDVDLFKCLMEIKGQMVCDENWCHSMFLTACGMGARNIVEYLLLIGVQINCSGPHYMTGVFYAIACRRQDTFELLAGQGADLRKGNCRGDTPLHVAVYKSDANVVQTLLMYKKYENWSLDVNAVDVNGLTPINLAFSLKPLNYQVISLLLAHREVDLAKPDNDGVTVIHRALSVSRCRMLGKLILRSDVNINARDKKGRTPLQMMIDNGHFFHIKHCLDFGADTKVLYRCEPSQLIKVCRNLALYRLKRKVADLEDDEHINVILGNWPIFHDHEDYTYTKAFCDEVELMKMVPILGALTYYDFLHANKRECVAIVSNLSLELFLMQLTNFQNYGHMLLKNYAIGLVNQTPWSLKMLKYL